MDTNTENLIVKYYYDGFSYRDIADKIPSVTKNMAIWFIDKMVKTGKMQRRGGKRGANDLNNIKRKIQVSNFIPIVASRKRDMPAIDIEKNRKYTKLDDGVEFLSLKRNQCHFPYTNTWCGHSVLLGSAYCEIHAKECSGGKGKKL